MQLLTGRNRHRLCLALAGGQFNNIGWECMQPLLPLLLMSRPVQVAVGALMACLRVRI